jgi:hypothetical protein
MANRFEYPDKCPACAKEGVRDDNGREINIGFDIDKAQISCVRGHVFEEIPGPEGIPEPPPLVVETETLPSVEEDQSRFAALKKQREPVSIEAVQSPMTMASGVSIGNGMMLPVEQNLNCFVSEGQAFELPGGDLLLGVRISETWRQAVEAEAEIKGMKTADYFAQWLQSEEMRDALSDLLANYWLANFQQTTGAGR